ncbi:PilT domain-containing protein [Candidatus Thiomargarita nelsonii]|uniref:PilT domain-containing protein n=1 Tax=Candidatus Thiomargarita nelsonii TaxID=1003181 RepID=A0A176RVM9_9GAMM|nr:PilT domain-containing protein [Candidatus Thiomargarita nelsonii]
MIGVDANILVRYAVKDNPQQTAQATDFLAKHRCLILKTVLLELVWVLASKSGYDLSRELVLERVRHILGLPNVVMQDAEHVVIALDWYEAGMDFADALHLASSYDLTAFATFDKKLSNKAALLNISHKVIFLQTKQK